MTRRPTTVFIVLASMLLAGCLGAVDEWIEDGENHPVMDWIAPELNLGYRVRSSPVLDTYDNCGALEEDLRNSLAEEMLVSLDQASYWHWDSWGWRGGGMVDDMVMEMDGGPVADQSTSGGAEASGSANSGSDSSAPPSSSGAGDREGQYSETNNQEEGVDEADFLKTDGYHIYMINNGQLVILGVPEFGEIELESNITLEGSPMQMLLADDQLVIISYVSYWNLEEDDPIRQAMLVDGGNSGGSGASGLTADAGMPYYRYTNMVKFTVIDVSNRSAPEINRELFLDGSYQTSRLVGNSLRAVSHSYAEIYGLQTYPVLPANYYQIDYDDPQRQNIWNQSVNSTIETNLEIISGLTLSDFVPRMHERLADGSVTELSTVSATCEEFAAATDSVGRGFTTIMTIELFGNDIEYELDHISSSWVEVYASQDMLVLAEPANDWWWYWRNTDYEEATNIHAFDISEVGLTTYIGSGRVTGSVNDQFSLSEFNGTIRVATTTDNSWGRWWFEDGEEWTGPTNDVHVLAPGEQGGEELLTIGHIGDIAEGERIWSCRFIGEKGYLVTFRNVDPLWTIDLSNPSDPQVIGELEVPGVSTYIHPLGDDHLLTIGMAGGEGGIGLDWGNTQISMFDVSDFANPNLAAAQQLSPVDEGGEDGWGWNWAYSEASYEHKAFTYWGPAELLAIPLSTYRYTYDEVVIDGKTYTHYGYEYVSQLILLDVDVENETLSIYGTIDHSNFYNGESGIREYYYSGNTNIRRSIFMGDYVYAFSSEGVTVTNYSSMALSDSLQLPEMVQPDYYYTEYYYEDDAVDAEGEETSGSSGESEPDEPAEESTDDD